ncbi:hypothetical protein ACFFRR_011916 [Megaselia abdita]
MSAFQNHRESMAPKSVRFNEKPTICCEKGENASRGVPCQDVLIPEDSSTKFCIPGDNSIPLICGKVQKHPYDRIWLFRPLKWRCKDTLQEKIKVPQYKEPSLGRILGVAFSTVNASYLKPEEKYVDLLTYATCLIAFGEWFITPEEEWDCLVLNQILEEGLKLLQDSMSDQYELTENSVNRTFVLCRNTMVVEVSDPFLLGRVVSEDMQIQNLHWGILKFFNKFQHGILLIGKNNYYLIWYNFGAYFLFDSFGRCSETLSRMSDGYASIICFKSIENLSHVLLNLSDTRADDMFTLRNIQMVTLLPCCVKFDWKDKERTNQYEILNHQHAVLKGHLHISSTHFKELRFKSTLTISLTALLYAKIDLPSIWTSLMVDEIILLGVKYYKMWSQCDLTDKFGIQDIPSRFQIGQYTVDVVVIPMKECGIWMCLPNYRQSQLTMSIKSCFEVASYLIVQIERRSYPMFRKNSYFYFLDAYKHTCSNDKKKLKVAAVHMVKTLDTLCCIFTQSILEIPSQRPFFIHILTVLNIKETTNEDVTAGIPCSCVVKTVSELDEEALSLNESIIDIHCKKDIEYLVEHELIEEDVVDLDSPGLSDTQLNANYLDFKNDVFGDGLQDDEEDNVEEKDSEVDLGECLESEKDDSECRIRREKALSQKKERKSKKDKNKNKKGKAGESSEKDNLKGEGDDQTDLKVTSGGQEDASGNKDSESSGQKDKSVDKGNSRGKDGSGGQGISDVDGDNDGGQDGSGQTRKTKGDNGIDNENSKDKSGDETGAIEGNEDEESKKKKEDDKTKSIQQNIEHTEKNRKEKEGKGVCNNNVYPGYSSVPYNLTVVGSESGSYESLCKLLRKGLNCTDRVLVMTSWGNYVVFKLDNSILVYSGCTCNVNRFRHLDLRTGTAGLICFKSCHEAILFILEGNSTNNSSRKKLDSIIDEICNQYCCD